MKAFKNALAAEYDFFDVVYIIADTTPHAKHYFECTTQEIEFAVRTGAVHEIEKNKFIREVV